MTENVKKGKVANKKTILFVCAGNTCRSPMAEMIFNFHAKKAGINYKAVSSGVSAFKGDKMNQNAVFALDALSITYRAGFAAKRLTLGMIRKADRVYCMTHSVAQYVRATTSNVKLAQPSDLQSVPKIEVFGDEVADPYGKNREAYLLAAELINQYCKTIIEDIAKK